MNPTPKNKQITFLLAGIGLALLAGALGWQVAGPVAGKVALPEIAQDDAPVVKSQSRPATVAATPRKQMPVKSFVEAQSPQVSLPGPSASSPPPALSSSPQPRAEESLQASTLPDSKTVIESSEVLEQVTAVDPALAGNFLVVNGQRVAIQQSLTSVGAGGTALDVVITPEAEAVVQNESDAVQSPTGRGFTYEEELFRSKWGWAAYDAASRAATWDLQKSAPAAR